MSISWVEVAGASFRTDKTSDELNTEFMGRLAMKKRYLPARLAIARSLAIETSAPVLDELATGNVIKGDTLFGDDASLYVWVALIVGHSGDTEIDKAKLISLVAAHWRRGIKLLDDEWKMSGKDIAKFVNRLVDVAEIPLGLPPASHLQFGSSPTDGGGLSSGQITVPIGDISEDVATKEKIEWKLNGAGGSPHSAIMGGVGSGKTRTAVAMLRSVREQAPDVPLIAFDFKGDLGEGNKTYQLDRLFDARVISPPRQPIPLNVLTLQSTDDLDITNAAYRFREAFANLKENRLGDRQRDTVYEAARQALSSQSPCELQHILNALIRVYEEKEMREDGAVSTMRELCRFPLFNPEFDLASFFQKSWLIKLPQDVPADSRKIVVNLVLNALDQYLNSLDDSNVDADGARSLRVLCMVDEAHQILRGKLPSLSNLIRMSRSKGGVIMLISQSPDDFSGEDDEFLNEMGLIAAFSTNAPAGNTRRILGQGANLGTLQDGQCFVKRRGDRTSKKIQSWSK